MPGRKYWSDIRPVIAIGRVTSWRAASKTSFTARWVSVVSQPTTTAPSRMIPTQYIQAARAASHHVNRTVETNSTRRDRNGSVYTASPVHQAAARPRSTGNRSRTYLMVADQTDEESRK